MVLHKLAANFGPRALRGLGARGFARYLARSLAALPAVFAERNLRPVDRAMRGRVELRHPVNDRRVVIDLDSYRAGDDAEGSYAFGLVREIWLRDVYLRPFRLPTQLDCVVDLGANRGIFALQACAFARRVVAVEAMDKYAAPLLENLAANAFDNLVLVNAFVGGPGFMAPGDSPAMDLAGVLALAEGGRVDLLKVDIEGSEFGLDLAPLAGVVRIAMELHPDYGDGEALLRAVRALGFDCRLFDEHLRPATLPAASFVYGVNTRLAGDAAWAGPAAAPAPPKPTPAMEPA
jgi:hypothetical protein